MSEDAEIRYTVRISPRAASDIDAEQFRLAEIAGPESARAWREGLFRDVATLAWSPRRFSTAPERGFTQEVRQLLFRRASGGAAWRVLFLIREKDEDTPSVILLHVRHGAQRPIGRREAGEIEGKE